MNSNVAAYWIAVGALALGLNSEYHQGRFVALHRVAESAGSVLCQVSARAEQTLAVATALTQGRANFSDSLLAAADRGEMARAQVVMIREEARAQAEMVREQVREQILAQKDVLRAQAEMRGADIQQLRWRVRSVNSGNAGRHPMTVVCPKTGASIVVSDWPDMNDDLPTVEVSDEF
jgi:hypothetical protein